MSTREELFFKNRKEAHTWLIDNGYRISIGKFYEDIKNNGFPALNADKTVSKYQVAVYGKGLEEHNTPDLSAMDRSAYLHQKEQAEAEIAQLKAQRMRREEDKYWIHARDAWSALAALIGDLRGAISRELYDSRRRIVEAAGGEMHREGEVFELCDGVVDAAFNRVAKQGITVQWEGDK